MFVSLPKVFAAMERVGYRNRYPVLCNRAFAAITSSVSVMEAIVSGLMDKWKISRNKSVALYRTSLRNCHGIIVCLSSYNVFFELPLPNGSVARFWMYWITSAT